MLLFACLNVNNNVFICISAIIILLMDKLTIKTVTLVVKESVFLIMGSC